MQRIGKRWIPILTLGLLVYGGFCASAEVEDNFVSLFNGENLSGWFPVGTPEAFVVKNDCIYTTGASPYPSWLRSEKEYENFVFRFEYQTEGWYEGGVVFHAPLDGPASKIGLKLHLRHEQQEYGARSPGAIYDAVEPLSIANHPSGEWNTCEIECNWPRLRITLNGEVIHDLDMEKNEALRYRLRRGYIGIQNLGNRAYFRNLQIRPLPDKEKWIHLFDAGMEGFNLFEDTEWRIDGDILTGKGKNGFVVTRQEFEGPYELQVWGKTIVNGNGGVHINWADEQKHIEIQCFNSPDCTNPTGSIYGISPAERVVSRDEEWFLLQIFNDGPYAMVWVNGEKVCETNQIKPPFKGGIGFQQHTHGTVIQYRGARVKMGRIR